MSTAPRRAPTRIRYASVRGAGPYAAVAPMSGAPRTTIVRMARAASSRVLRSSVWNSNGKRDWSMTRTAPDSSGQIAR